MFDHDIQLDFGPLPPTNKSRFIWDSDEWWKWFCAHRRKPSVASVFSRLCEYDVFLSFHGARPLEVSSFYGGGLRTGDIELLNERAKEIFLSVGYPEITPAILERAIAGASDIDAKKAFAVIDGRELSGHYLIYGSEHICGIAASMVRESGIECRQILKKIGTPTVFRIDVPRELIPEYQLRELAKCVVEMCWDARKKERPPRLDYSWIVREEIPGIHFVDHVHPERIPDPLFQYIPYQYRDNFPCFV